ncbi:hypothetical protein Pmani_008643 [Petrolisthes manimaculis]|uniref:Uncharacterized protein n=1 Tax=Petrolisthes manimaculis TaxID=1843537 RepID=A0AAE1UEF0_9EUCA|nr:hypothetical protein Pmani_008643 [Petrolisthes manimaculis]
MDDHMEQEGRWPVNKIPAVNTTSTTPQQSPIQPQATQPDNSMAEVLQTLKENTQERRGIIQQCLMQPRGQSLPLPPRHPHHNINHHLRSGGHGDSNSYRFAHTTNTTGGTQRTAYNQGNY